MRKPNKLYTFKNVKNVDFRTVWASGVFGGMTAKGQLNMNFFLDTLELPKSVQHEIIGNDLAINPLPAPPVEPSSVREVQFGLLLDLEVAKTVVKWMQEHINEFEQRFGDINKERG
jgi:hypothetical protein